MPGEYRLMLTCVVVRGAVADRTVSPVVLALSVMLLATSLITETSGNIPASPAVLRIADGTW
jgi:hypothetical protein